jgi:PleD family two-component response regulator
MQENIEAVRFIAYQDYLTGLLNRRAEAQCTAFCLSVEQSTVCFADAVIAVTVSIGVSRVPASNLDGMLKQADENLYLARQAGRNRVVLTRFNDPVKNN